MKPAEHGLCELDSALPVLLRGDVELREARRRTDVLRDRCAELAQHVAEDDARALPRAQPSGRLALPARRAGDQDDLVREPTGQRQAPTTVLIGGFYGRRRAARRSRAGRTNERATAPYFLTSRRGCCRVGHAEAVTFSVHRTRDRGSCGSSSPALSTFRSEKEESACPQAHPRRDRRVHRPALSSATSSVRNRSRTRAARPPAASFTGRKPTLT